MAAGILPNSRFSLSKSRRRAGSAQIYDGTAPWSTLVLRSSTSSVRQAVRPVGTVPVSAFLRR
jgi:hypothetical protein